MKSIRGRIIHSCKGKRCLQSVSPIAFGISNHSQQGIASRVGASFLKQPSRRPAEKIILRGQPGDQLFVCLFRQVKVARRPGSFLVADSIQTTFQTIDACGVPVGVLIAVVPVVPIEDIQRSIRPGFLNHGHEPGIVRGQEVVFAGSLVGGSIPFNPVDVDASAVNVSHVQLAAVLFGIRITVEIVDTAIGRFLVLMLDDAFDLPGERWIGAPLSMVVARFGQVPQVIDDAGTDEGFAVCIEGDSPGIAGSFAKDLEFPSPRMDTEQGTGDGPAGMILLVVGIGFGVFHV